MTLDDSSMIWVYSDNKFLCEQYIKEISKYKNLNIHYVDNLDGFKIKSLFEKQEVNNGDYLTVYSCKSYKDEIDITNVKNIIIVTEKYSGNYDYCVFPKLEQWQIIDYVYSVCEGVDKSDLDWLLKLCNYDIYRLQQEIDKIIIFPEVERKYLFKDFTSSDVFSDLSDKTIFDFSNAIQTRNKEELITIYKQLESCDIEPLGIATILYSNYRKMIRVCCQHAATEANTGLKRNQIFAIKKLAEKYSMSQVINIFKFLCDIEFKLKLGELPQDKLLDYIVLNVISM